VKNPDGTDNYAVEATQNFAAGLKGHLLLIHGTMDNNVPPYNTLLVADALIKANKEFDMLMIPNSGHGFAPANYVMRRRWDYFVKYLLDADPPRDVRDSVGARRRRPWRPRQRTGRHQR
jgi:dipeptidyl aminopeptidase/acylaminoacyl peptidase